MKIELTDEIKKFTEFAKEEITISRFEHSQRVADIALELSIIHGYKFPSDAYLAGILHDITKQKNNSFHIEIFKNHNFKYIDLPTQAYHAFSAFFVLQDRFNFNKIEVLNSIQFHTLGSDDMSLLEKILYVSDFLGSEYALRAEEYSLWLENSKKDIYFGMYLKSSKTIQDLTEKRLPIHTNTITVYNNSVKRLVANHSIS